MPQPMSQRYWDDVQEGDDLPGHSIPITWTEIVIHVGAAQNYDLVHFDREYTQGGGIRDVFMHTGWYNGHFGKILSDWAGLDGWVRKFRQEMRRMNHPGDTTSFKGRVQRTYEQDGRHLVDLELWAENQREGKTTLAAATVELPVRGAGAVPFPAVPDYALRMSPTAGESPTPPFAPRESLRSAEDFLVEARKAIGWESKPTTFTYPVEYEPVRRYCHMVREDNPLYLNPAYAETTRFGGVIAPLQFPYVTREFWPPPSDPRLAMGSPFVPAPTPGDHPINLSSEEEYFRPVRIGDQITEKQRMADIYIKSIRVDPKSFWIVSERIFWNQRGEVVKISRGTLVKHRTPEEIAAMAE
ncbi:MAG: MaoC family dehydratase N-terminal domain-containing protein [Chloroflexi bacterium]|nr:MaoC family dehydratase N-terminal domain-containing protein [Chloroflexota bacterium]